MACSSCSCSSAGEVAISAAERSDLVSGVFDLRGGCGSGLTSFTPGSGASLASSAEYS